MAIGTPVEIAGANSKDAGTTLVITVPAGGVPAGASIFVLTGIALDSAITSIVDTAGNTYVEDVTVLNSTTATRSAIRSVHNCLALAQNDTITITFATTANRAARAFYVTGLAATSVLDVTATGTGNSTALATGTAARTYADEIVIGNMAHRGPVEETFTAGAPAGLQYTALVEDGTTGGGGAGNVTVNPEYSIVSVTGTDDADGTIGTARAFAVLLATYRGALPPGLGPSLDMRQPLADFGAMLRH